MDKVSVQGEKPSCFDSRSREMCEELLMMKNHREASMNDEFVEVDKLVRIC